MVKLKSCKIKTWRMAMKVEMKVLMKVSIKVVMKVVMKVNVMTGWVGDMVQCLILRG